MSEKGGNIRGNWGLCVWLEMLKGRPSASATRTKWLAVCQGRLSTLVGHAKGYLAQLDKTRRLYDETLA